MPSLDGFRAARAPRAREAAEAACTRQAPDIILADSGVLGEDRTDGIRRLRQSCPGARIIGYTAGTRAMEGVDSQFLKGDPFEDVLAEIRKGRLEERA